MTARYTVNSTLPIPLCSARLLLRRLHSGDAPALHSYRSLPEVARFQSWSSFKLDDATRFIEEQAATQPNVPGTWFQFAIVDSATDTLVGDCGLHCLLDEPQQMELGITLNPLHQKRGYATEALECLLDSVFVTLAKHRVFAVTDANNVAAASLFTRLGFREEAHFIEHRLFKGNWGSERVFAILGREWHSRRALT